MSKKRSNVALGRQREELRTVLQPIETMKMRQKFRDNAAVEERSRARLRQMKRDREEAEEKKRKTTFPPDSHDILLEDESNIDVIGPKDVDFSKTRVRHSIVCHRNKAHRSAEEAAEEHRKKVKEEERSLNERRKDLEERSNVRGENAISLVLAERDRVRLGEDLSRLGTMHDQMKTWMGSKHATWQSIVGRERPDRARNKQKEMEERFERLFMTAPTVDYPSVTVHTDGLEEKPRSPIAYDGQDVKRLSPPTTVLPPSNFLDRDEEMQSPSPPVSSGVPQHPTPVRAKVDGDIWQKGDRQRASGYQEASMDARRRAQADFSRVEQPAGNVARSGLLTEATPDSVRIVSGTRTTGDRIRGYRTSQATTERSYFDHRQPVESLAHAARESGESDERAERTRYPIQGLNLGTFPSVPRGSSETLSAQIEERKGEERAQSSQFVQGSLEQESLEESQDESEDLSAHSLFESARSSSILSASPLSEDQREVGPEVDSFQVLGKNMRAAIQNMETLLRREPAADIAHRPADLRRDGTASDRQDLRRKEPRSIPSALPDTLDLSLPKEVTEAGNLPHETSSAREVYVKSEKQGAERELPRAGSPLPFYAAPAPSLTTVAQPVENTPEKRKQAGEELFEEEKLYKRDNLDDERSVHPEFHDKEKPTGTIINDHQQVASVLTLVCTLCGSSSAFPSCWGGRSTYGKLGGRRGFRC